MIRYIEISDIMSLHQLIIKDFGGRDGLRDAGRLKAVVAAPAQHVFGKELYATLQAKAAVYLHHIIADHPFLDGNKRTALTVTGIFLTRNKYQLTASPQEAEDFVVRIAAERLAIEQVIHWLKLNTQPV